MKGKCLAEDEVPETVRGRDNLVPHVYKWGSFAGHKITARPSSEMAVQQVIGGEGLDWGVDVGENENAQQ
jgi:hypothetical protein